MKYYTVILQPDEDESLGAAQAMSAYLASHLEVIVAISVSENQLSEIVKDRLNGMVEERVVGIVREMGE